MKIFSQAFLQETGKLFSCVVFCVYTWSTLISFWNLPSFLLRYTLGEIISFLAYQYALAFIESVAVTFFVVVLAFVVPVRRVRSEFSITGALFVFSLAIGALIFKEITAITTWNAETFRVDVASAGKLTAGLWLFAVLGLPLLSIFLSQNAKIKSFIKTFLDNLAVLTALYVALSFLSVGVVLYRNLN